MNDYMILQLFTFIRINTQNPVKLPLKHTDGVTVG